LIGGRAVAARIDLGKVAVGAFLIPWWNRRAFARALAVPLLTLAALTLSWHYAKAYVPTWAGWALYGVYWALFGLFAVTTHRLVLLDPAAVAARMVPRWSGRETRFFLRIVAVGVVFALLHLSQMVVPGTLPECGHPVGGCGGVGGGHDITAGSPSTCVGTGCAVSPVNPSPTWPLELFPQQ